MRMRWPSVTPAGMRTLTWRGRRSTPRPWQVGHGSVTSVPRPPHCGQGELNEKKPWLSSSTPRPSQRGQVVGAVPGLAPLPWQVEQAASDTRLTDVSTPVDRVEERQVQLGLEVGAALGTGTPRRAPSGPPAPAAAEQAAEQVVDVGGGEVEVAGVAAGRAGTEAAPEPGTSGPMPPIGPSRRTSSYSLRLASSPTTS